MPDPEITRALRELEQWCHAEYGRQAEVARLLGVSRQLISAWFSGKATPTWETGLKIQAFLKTQKNRRRKTE